MWIKEGSSKVKLTKTIADIKHVTVKSGGMEYPLYRITGFANFLNTSEATKWKGMPVSYYFDGYENTLMIHPKPDKRYSLTVVALVVKVL